MSTNNRHAEPEKLQEALRHTMPKARPSFEHDLELRLLTEFTSIDKEKELMTAYDYARDAAIPPQARMKRQAQTAPLTLAAAVIVLVVVGAMLVLAMKNSEPPMASTSFIGEATDTPLPTTLSTGMPLTPTAIMTGAHQVTLPRARLDVYGIVTLQAWTLVDVMVVTSKYDAGSEDISISIERVASGAMVMPSPEGNFDWEYVILTVDSDITQELETMAATHRDRLPMFLVPHVADDPQPIQGIMPTIVPMVTATMVRTPTMMMPSAIPPEMVIPPVPPAIESLEPTVPPRVMPSQTLVQP